MIPFHCFWLCWVFAAAWASFSGCGELGLLFVGVHRLLTAVVLLLQSMGSRYMGLSTCSLRAQ